MLSVSLVRDRYDDYGRYRGLHLYLGKFLVYFVQHPKTKKWGLGVRMKNAAR